LEQQINARSAGEGKSLKAIVENLNRQLEDSEKLINALNDNVVKKKLLISQLQMHNSRISNSNESSGSHSTTSNQKIQSDGQENPPVDEENDVN
jgi:hypothetical protein